MRRLPATSLALVIMMTGAGLTACSHRQTAPNVPMIRVPPRIDLTQHELIGVVPVVSTSRGELGPLATRRLMDWSRRDQGIVRMVELDSVAARARTGGGSRWSPEAVKSLGRQHGVATVMVGEIVVSDVRPNVRIGATLRSGELTALVNVSLSVQLLETSTGASIWSNSAQVTQNVGHLSVLEGRNITFDAADPESAYGPLVDALVEQVTRDFRATWEQAQG